MKMSRGSGALLAFLAFGVILNVVPLGSRRDVEDGTVSGSSAGIAETGAQRATEPGPEWQSGRDDGSEETTGTAGEPSPVPDRNITLDSYVLDKDASVQWKLPTRLREISGLALTNDGRLLTHNDEKGIVYEVDFRHGQVLKGFGLARGSAVTTDDFEGIAIVDERIFMITSAGRIYEFREGADGDRVAYKVYNTGIGAACEIEGLAYEPDGNVLLLMCKNPLSRDLQEQVAIYRWSIESQEVVAGGRTVIPLSDFTDHIKGKKFQPSGIERHPVSGNYYLVAARQAALAEVTPDGMVVSVRTLPKDWHRQAEGITFAADLSLIVSDEGDGKRGRLTVYPLSAEQ